MNKIGQALTLEEVLRRFSETHGNTYDYSEVVYTRTDSKVSIICGSHGVFNQMPPDHWRGQGCPECGKNRRTKRQTSDRCRFIEKAKKVHGETYSYDKVVYYNSNTKVVIMCSEHGEFQKSPNKHLAGQGCPLCSFLLPVGATTDQFISAARKIHGDRYDYSLTKYTGTEKHVIILCPTHGPFKVTPYHHLRGANCSSCAGHGFKYNQPATLYYLRLVIDGNTYYKIGVTNRSVKERFSLPEFNSLVVIHTQGFAVGRDAFLFEQGVIKKFLKYKYRGKDILFNGNTEIFTKDVLELDSNDSLKCSGNSAKYGIMP